MAVGPSVQDSVVSPSDFPSMLFHHVHRGRKTLRNRFLVLKPLRKRKEFETENSCEIIQVIEGVEDSVINSGLELKRN